MKTVDENHLRPSQIDGDWNEADKRRDRAFLFKLLFFGFVAACMDIPHLEIGGLNIKIAFFVFPIYLTVLFARYGFRMNAGDLVMSGLFIVSVLPSVFYSVSILHSIAFFIGACVCVGAMVATSKIVSRLGADFVRCVILFYRFSVIVTVVLVALRVQQRGCYTFYEPSYYTIALIPYFCVTFYRLSMGPARFAALDCAMILLAIGVSQSFSMALWAFISLFWARIHARKLRLIQVVALLICVMGLGYVAYLVDPRTQNFVGIINEFRMDEEWFARIAIDLAGNRVQRIYMAADMIPEHWMAGVGLGVFKKFATNCLETADYSILGMSAYDFTADTNAVCVYLEILAEAGLFGFLGFMLLLFRVYGCGRSNPVSKPITWAFLITSFALIVESSYLRPYVWALYGCVLGLSRLPLEIDPVDFYVRGGLSPAKGSGVALRD